MSDALFWSDCYGSSVIVIEGINMLNPLPLLPFLRVEEFVQNDHMPTNARVSIREWLRAVAPGLVVQERIFECEKGHKLLTHIENYDVTGFDVTGSQRHIYGWQ